MAASLLVDHFGLLGFPREPVTLIKLFGAGLLFAGVVLVAR
jgi:transporter family-2 protein